MAKEYVAIDMDSPAHVWSIGYKIGEAVLDESLDVETLSEHGTPYTIIQTPVSDYLQERGFEIAQGEIELDGLAHFSDPKRLLGLQFETTVTKVGNTAHVLVSRRLLGKRVKVSVEPVE
jgi:putative transposon-encoded protein